VKRKKEPGREKSPNGCNHYETGNGLKMYIYLRSKKVEGQGKNLVCTKRNICGIRQQLRRVRATRCHVRGIIQRKRSRPHVRRGMHRKGNACKRRGLMKHRLGKEKTYRGCMRHPFSSLHSYSGERAVQKLCAEKGQRV